MVNLTIEITLESDTSFGRGDGVAGLVDSEIRHDEDGLPTISGRGIKGLLVNECANLIFALEKQGKEKRWIEAANRLYGGPGETKDEVGRLQVGSGRQAPDLVYMIHRDVVGKDLSREAVLDSLTGIRRQTAIDPESGAPLEESLRAIRVALRGLVFYAPLDFTGGEPDEDQLALLAACTLALRRAGTGRRRGRGKVRVRLTDTELLENNFSPRPDQTYELFRPFKQEVNPCMP